MVTTYQMLIKILVEKLGFIILDGEQDDFSINDYIVDSIVFIQFIVFIEEELNKKLPDDFLNYDILNSAKGFAEKIEAFIESSNQDG